MISRWRYYSIPVGYLAPVLALGFAADAINIYSHFVSQLEYAEC